MRQKTFTQKLRKKNYKFEKKLHSFSLKTVVNDGY